jgi:Mg-chelatase subunit ChlD
MRFAGLTVSTIFTLAALGCAKTADLSAPGTPGGGYAAEPMAPESVALASDSESPPAQIAESSGVRAGEWDDNANYRDFQRYLATQSGIHRVAVEKRRFIVVRDAKGKGVPNCKLTVSDSTQRRAELVTTASGRAILFPRAEGLAGDSLFVTTSCQGGQANAKLDLSAADGVTELKLAKERSLPARRTIDIAFVLDTTGSMSEEITAVKATIRQVSAKLANQDLDVRVGLVEYKDRSDEFVTRVYPMSNDLRAFEGKVSHLNASGGGDQPESLNEGLAVALSKLSWSPDSVARLGFVIADAPPHLDYEQDTSYALSMRAANRRGIKLFTIAASGMDDLGQAVFRQIAQYTGGTNLFVLRGGAGPQSTGAGDAKSSCGGTHQNYSSGNLDALIVAKIRRELASLDADPMRIAGLGKDENAKPCSERLVLADDAAKSPTGE